MIDLRRHKIVIDADLSNLKHVIWISQFLQRLCQAGSLSILNAVWSLGIDEFAQLNEKPELHAQYLGQVSLTRSLSDLFKSGVGMANSYRRMEEEQALPLLTTSLQAPNALPHKLYFELDLYMQNLRLKAMNMMLSKGDEKPQERPKAKASLKRYTTESDSKEASILDGASSVSSQKTGSQTTRKVNLKSEGSSSSLVQRKFPSRSTAEEQLGTACARQSTNPTHFKRQSSGFSSALDEILKA